MEEQKTINPTVPRNSKLASWTMILGIASFIVCLVCTILLFSVVGVIDIAPFVLLGVFISAITSVILGVIAAILIATSKGLLRGAGKVTTGIIMGGLTFMLLVLVAIAIPSNSFIYDQLQKNQLKKSGHHTPENNEPQQATNASVVKQITELDTYKMKSSDWYKIEPIAFLNYLKQSKAAFVTIWETPPSDWIKEADVEKLIKLIDSQELCSSVVSSLCSDIPMVKSSTEGREAMFLIEGFRKGHYPASTSSAYKMNPKEIKKWWDKRK